PSASGGPLQLASEPFFIGIHDPFGQSAGGSSFDPTVFNLFDSWSNLDNADDPRASIARGQALFNTKPIKIKGVGGLNDVLGMAMIAGTCGTCHNSPNAGNHSTPLMLNVGAADVTAPG